ncbi:MAG: SIS domain-containing protein [Oscillospiraceae bacterium]|jgi:arabinose-5-phosphate isomerase|nr:SIS domain-containing protein [Oscillospiraceae bacterium]
MEYFSRTLNIINNAIHSIRAEEFTALKKDCIDTIVRNSKLIATGLGKNVPICEKFVGTLNSIGIPAAFMHTNSAIHGDLGIVNDGDLVIVLTKSGETVESVYLVDLLKKRNCTIWLLSFKRGSTLYRELESKLIIELEHEGDQWDILPNNSSIMNLVVLQELAMELAKELRIEINVLRRNHPGGDIGMQLGG